MSNRKLVMLAADYVPNKFKAEGSFLSEKLDGVRALWLPWTRGIAVENIPWANRERDKRDYVCSGLWTRRGKPIVSPDWWLDNLPKDMPLDGELFIGRKLFNKTIGTVRKLIPVDNEWKEITYQLFDIPNYKEFFRDGQIREGGEAGHPAYEVYMRSHWAVDFNLMGDPFYQPKRFTEVVSIFNKREWSSVVRPIRFKQLPIFTQAAEEMVRSELEEVTAIGGEGLMLRRPHTIWEPIRHNELVKVKKLLDSEAQIIGYVFGEGKYLGMVGAYRVRWNNVTFDLSGFTDAERKVKFEYLNLAKQKPGEFIALDVSEDFPIGQAITFTYNETTPEGKPRFARYLRKFD